MFKLADCLREPLLLPPKAKKEKVRRRFETVDIVCVVGKVAYRTKADAELAMHGHRSPGRRLRSFKCDFCPYYHLGNRR